MESTQVRKLLEKRVKQAGSQRALARELGVSAAFLNDILLGKREPSGKPLEALGLRRIISYERVI